MAQFKEVGNLPDMNRHKQMAMGQSIVTGDSSVNTQRSSRYANTPSSSPNFGVTGCLGGKPCVPNPNRGMAHMPMDDDDRGARSPFRNGNGSMGNQAAPDHGPQHHRGRR